jgi:replicative DNA helicase
MHTVAGMQRSLFSDSTFRTGISAIDKETGGFRLGNIMTIAGDTGSMKTMSSMWLILQMLKENPTFKALYFEKEMPSKDVYRRLVCMFGNITEKDLSEIPVNDALKMLKDISERSEVAALLSRFFVVDTNNFDTVADMYKYILLHKPTIWCLDYLTQLHGSGNTTDVASKVRNDINDLKRIVHRTGTFGIVLCQLNKNTVEQRRDKRPIMDDIEWSSDIKKLSAYVFSTFFPYKYYANEEIRRYYYLISLKNRFNSLFTLALTAIPEYSTFSHPPQDELLEYKRFYEGYESGRITQ